MNRPNEHAEITGLLELVEIVRNRRFEQLERKFEIARSRKETQANLSRVIQEDMFLKRLVQDYSFCRYINGRVMKCSWAKSHMKELGLMLLADMLYPQRMPLRKIDTIKRKTSKDFGSDGNRSGYETRTRARIIRDYYPELFELLSREDSYKKTHESFKTILRSKERLPSTSFDDLRGSFYLAFLAHQYGSTEDGLKAHNRRMIIGTRLAQGDPDEILSLMEFNTGLKQSLGILRQELGEPSEEGRWLLEQVLTNGPAVLVIHTMMLDSVRARWFGERPFSSRMKILNRKCRLSYSDDDARNAVDRNLFWFGNPEVMASRILMAAFGFADNGKHIPAIRLANACLPKIPPDSPYKSIAHRCLGFAYLTACSPRRALTEFRESERGMLSLGMKAEAAFDEGFIAESYIGLGKSREADKEWKHSLDRIKASMGGRTLDPRMLLMLVDAAKRTGNARVQQELLELGFEQSSRLDDPGFSIIFSRRMTDFFNLYR